ncbi:MAG TPA: ricin-type beta-trefoil lectin domain protein [Streptosporangiaceae bacterium]
MITAAAVAAAVIVTAPLLAFANPAGTGTGHVNSQSIDGTVLVAPHSLPGTPSAAAAGKASTTCVKFAARAGWPDNGYFAGALVTAAAICVGESRGSSGFYVCDNQAGNIIGQGTVSPGHPVKCPTGTFSYDRGLWQLNSKTASKVSDKCAFNAGCNAEQAYLFSQRGTDFTPWSSYDQDTYTPFIDPVQDVVNGLRTGTVTSAELGECLAAGKAAGGAKLIIVNCGDGAATQQWSLASGKLRLGSHCAALLSRTGNSKVVLSKCANAKNQDWAAFGRFELRNAADGKCLTDPGGSLKADTDVDVTNCTNAKPQTWWLP